MTRYELGRLFRDRRLNAVLSWSFVALLTGVAVEEVLTGDLPSAVFAAVVAAVAVVPPVQYRSPWVTLPWEVLGLATVPTVGRAVATWPPAFDVASYLAVAAFALIIAVELDAFTPVRMTPGFAVLFVVVTTMAAAGVWAVVRWSFDVFLDVGFIESERRLMLEFVYSTAAGVIAGGVFRYYLTHNTVTERLPEAAPSPGSVSADTSSRTAEER